MARSKMVQGVFGRGRGAVVLCAVALGCGSGSQGGPTQLSATETITFATTIDTKVDLLFVIANSANQVFNQEKLLQQIPTFVQILQNLPNPLDLHVAVVTTDMGAPSDAQIGCTQNGDDGAFRSATTGNCIATGLANGATYLTTANGVSNFTGDLATTLQCIGLLGSTGCGFGQPLAALDRALGADGSPPPATNAGFLRPDAYLAVVFLADQDDCSVPAGTQLFSLAVGGSNEQNISNALGPLNHYRCNRYGQLCQDSSGQTIMPPLTPPAGATLSELTNCTSNDTASGLLTPVAQFVSDIKSLKPDPDNQIQVSAILGPVTPYGVVWAAPTPDVHNPQPGELWPDIAHSCGAQGGADVNPEATQVTTDGSFGDPGVRLSQFVNSFSGGTLGSICDPSYLSALSAIANKVGALPALPCLTGKIQLTGQGLPNCTVTAHFAQPDGTLLDEAYQRCQATGGATPCWNFSSGNTACDGLLFSFVETTPSTNVTVSCAVCEPGISAPGC